MNILNIQECIKTRLWTYSEQETESVLELAETIHICVDCTEYNIHNKLKHSKLAYNGFSKNLQGIQSGTQAASTPFKQEEEVYVIYQPEYQRNLGLGLPVDYVLYYYFDFMQNIYFFFIYPSM